MTSVGDKSTIIPALGGKEISVPQSTVSVGDKVAILNSKGMQVCYPLTTPAVGDKIITSPSLGGKTIAIKGGETVDVYILAGTGYHYAAPLDVTRPYILRSTDEGLSFTRVLEANVANMAFTFVTISGDVSVAGTYPYGKIYRSIDKGASWALLAATDIFGVNGGYTDCTWFSSTVVYVTSWNSSTSQGKVWKSSDAGATWSTIATTTFHPHKIECCKNGVLIIGTYSASYDAKIYRSSDSGVTWTPVYTIPVLGTTFTALQYLENGIVIAGGGGGRGSPYYTYPGHLFRSTDNGLTWVDLGLMAIYWPDVTWYYYCGGGLVHGGTGLNQFLESIDYGYSFHFLPGDWHSPGFSNDCITLRDKKTVVNTCAGESYSDGLLYSSDRFALYTLVVPATSPFTQHVFTCISSNLERS